MAPWTRKAHPAPRETRLPPKASGSAWPALALLALSAGLGACGEDELSKSGFTLTGTPWVPNVPGVSAANHDPAVTVTQQVLAPVAGQVTGLGEGMSGREITVTLDLSEDLGAHGSFTLVAEPVSFPTSQMDGGAMAVLTYLSDGTNDLINLTRGGGGGCMQSGMFTCSSGSCAFNSGCTVDWPSAYTDATHWRQHQLDLTFRSPASVNTFPTCDWSGGTDQSARDASCPFNTTFFSGGALRRGTYTARYVLVADSYSSVPLEARYRAAVQVRLIKKKRAVDTVPGALDVNLVFVGNQVSQASRNAQGKINLDTLMASVHEFYSGPNVNVKLGTIRSFEWIDSGEAYANVGENDLGRMVQEAGSLLPSETSGKAINIFFVDTIAEETSLLGIAGGINGPSVHGLPNSGVVVATFGKLDRYNPGCSAAPCSLQQVEYDFADLEQTIAHEMGHYLGLNHLSESSGASHDLVRDTPICTAKEPGKSRISLYSCRALDTNAYSLSGATCSSVCTGYNPGTGSFCAAAPECSFNYMMYWSSKYFKEGLGTGDGSLFSAQNGQIVNFHPLVQ